ncbi:MAG TPA: TolC family protein [Verrucomicrobiae bacterium]
MTTSRLVKTQLRMQVGKSSPLRLPVVLFIIIMTGLNLQAVDPITNAPGWLTQPLSLPEALNIALSRNSTLLKAQSDLEAARGVSIQTKAIALPKVRGSGRYAHDEAVERSIFGNFKTPQDQWQGDVRITQSIYEGGRIRSSIRTAKLTIEQATLRYANAVADVLLDVRTAYYNILEAQQRITVQEASVRLLSEEFTNTTKRFDAGTVPRFDVLRAEVEVANARPRLIRANNDYRVAKNNLAVALGFNLPRNIGQEIPLTLTDKLEAEPYPLELSNAIAEAIKNRPELGVARAEEALRSEQIVRAKAGYKPSVQVFGGYGGRNATFVDDFFQDVSGAIGGIELSWDFFDGNLTRGRVIEAKALRERAHYDTEDLARRIELEVRTSFSEFIQASEVLESQKKVQEQAEESLRLAIARYDAGTGTQLDVLNAQTSLTEARTTQIQALRDYDVARARLRRAIGEDVAQLPATKPARVNSAK